MRALTHISVVTHASDGSEQRISFAEGDKVEGVPETVIAKLTAQGSVGPDRKREE